MPKQTCVCDYPYFIFLTQQRAWYRPWKKYGAKCGECDLEMDQHAIKRFMDKLFAQ